MTESNEKIPYMRRYYSLNKDKMDENSRKCYWRNIDERREKARQNYVKNREKILARAKELRDIKNPPKKRGRPRKDISDKLNEIKKLEEEIEKLTKEILKN